MSSFRPNPEDIGPDGYLKDTKSAVEFKEKVTEFNKNLYSKEAREERGDIIDYNTVKIEDAPKVATAGFGDNKMIIYLVVGGALLWYLNKEGYLKKILK